MAANEKVLLQMKNFMHIASPKSSKEKGIQVVYQEIDTALVPYISVAENCKYFKSLVQGLS